MKFYLKERNKSEIEDIKYVFQNNDNSSLAEICDWYKLYTVIYCNYRNKFISKIKSLKYINSENLIKEVDKYCIQEALNLSYRCVIEEINNLRKRNKLIGTSSEKRYLYFCNDLCSNKNYVIKFYRTYPELKSLISLKMKQIVEYLIEVCSNVSQDNIEISKKFFNSTSITLTGMNFSLGDTHNDGKFVCLLKFIDDKKLIYKPRNMEIDCKLNELKKFICEKSGEVINIYVPETINKSDHGYASYVLEKKCTSDLEVRIYYKNMGYLLALLYILQSKDFHGENIVTSKNRPYLIDNETILHQID